jgi:ABC-type transporter Mla subunit MlaD
MDGRAQVILNQQSAEELKMSNQKIENVTKNGQDVSKKLKETEERLYQTELCLEESKKLNKYQMEKLTNTLEHLNSTIKIAEEAFVEIQHLKHEKQQIEDESKELASTIGSVIETASNKIHQDVEELKSRHKIESEKSSMEIENLRRLIEIERDGRTGALRQAELLEEKLSSLDLKPLATTIVSYLSLCNFYLKFEI